jgi:hypothetical protein
MTDNSGREKLTWHIPCNLSGMKRMVLIALLFAFLNSVPCRGDIFQEKVIKLTTELEETVERAEIKDLAPQISRILKLDATVVAVLLSKDYKLGDIALFKLVLDKTKAAPIQLVEDVTPTTLAQKAQAVKIEPGELEEFFDSVNAEFAFYMLDHKKMKKKKS